MLKHIAMLTGRVIWIDWPLPIVFIEAAVVIGSNILIVWTENRLKRSIQSNVPHVP